MKTVIWIRAFSQTHEIERNGKLTVTEIEDYIKKNFVDTATWIKYKHLEKGFEYEYQQNPNYIAPEEIGLGIINVKQYRKTHDNEK